MSLVSTKLTLPTLPTAESEHYTPALSRLPPCPPLITLLQNFPFPSTRLSLLRGFLAAPFCFPAFEPPPGTLIKYIFRLIPSLLGFRGTVTIQGQAVQTPIPDCPCFSVSPGTELPSPFVACSQCCSSLCCVQLMTHLSLASYTPSSLCAQWPSAQSSPSIPRLLRDSVNPEVTCALVHVAAAEPSHCHGWCSTECWLFLHQAPESQAWAAGCTASFSVRWGVVPREGKDLPGARILEKSHMLQLLN